MPKPRLRAPLVSRIDQRAPERADAMWQQIAARRAPAPGENRRWRAPVAWLAAACAACLVWYALDGQPTGDVRPRALTTTDGSMLPAQIAPREHYQTLDLSDGSRM